MRTQSKDTDPRVERVQIELLRAAGSSQRVAKAMSMSQTALELSRRAICRAQPELDERSARLRFVELNYGDALAKRVRQHLRALDERQPSHHHAE